jgi:hypothetical protein
MRKRSFYQDRLGANTGKVEQRVVAPFFAGVIDNRTVRRADVDIAFTSVLQQRGTPGKNKKTHITAASFADALRLVAYREHALAAAYVCHASETQLSGRPVVSL